MAKARAKAAKPAAGPAPGKAAKASAKASGKSARRGAAGDLGQRAIDATMRLAAAQGWRNVSLSAIADACGVGVMELYALYPSRGAILAAFARQIDGQVMKGGAPADDPGDAAESPRDRLFDVMMRRYDALKPYRAAIAEIVADAPRDPLALLCLCGQGQRSMGWMLEAAAIPSGGPLGLLKAKGLGAIHLAVLRVWLKDDSDDLARTMAALDTALRRIEPLANTLFARG